MLAALREKAIHAGSFGTLLTVRASNLLGRCDRRIYHCGVKTWKRARHVLGPCELKPMFLSYGVEQDDSLTLLRLFKQQA
jgi:hypothetical protein